MSLKVDVSDIISDHLRTLVDDRSGKPSSTDWVIFLAIPVLVALLLVWRSVSLTAETANTIITALAIFAGLLFNLLLLAHSLIRKPIGDDGGSSTERRLLRQIYVNISFAILVALASILALIVRVPFKEGLIAVFLDFVVYVFLVNFLLTLLMVLKRIHIMLSEEFS